MSRNFLSFESILFFLSIVVGLSLVAISPVVIPVRAVAQTVPSGSLTPTPSVSPGTSTTATDQGPHFFAGDTIVLTQDLKGDVYIAGQNVRIENTIDGDLLVAAAQVTITGTVTQDVRAAGAHVDIRGRVGGNLTAAAATLTLDRQAQVDGSLVGGAGTTDIYGQIGGNTWLRGSVITVGGRLDRDLNLRSEQLRVQDQAVIIGNLIGVTTEPAVISEVAQVTNQRQLRQLSTTERHQTQKMEVGLKATAAWLVLTLLMGALAGSVMLALFPKVAQRSSDTLLTRPWACLGWGISHLILTPIAALLLMISILGLPIGVILLLLYSLSLLAGGWVVALAVGRKVWVPERSSYSKQLLQFSGGLLILKLLDLTPVLGWLIKLIVSIMGMGALVINFKESWWGYTTQPFTPERELTVIEPQISARKTAVTPHTRNSTLRVSKLKAPRKVAAPQVAKSGGRSKK